MRNKVISLYAILSDTYIVYIFSYDEALKVPGVDNIFIKFITRSHYLKVASPPVVWNTMPGCSGFGSASWKQSICAASGTYTQQLYD